jgi:hypothetical protein
MKRIIIICEGPTEQEFCKKTLSPYLAAKKIYVQAPRIEKSNGGIVKWSALKEQIENHLKQDPVCSVSLFIDYYGIYAKHNFPAWEEASKIADKNDRLSYLEQKMKDNIDEKLRYRFIPYMQLHEFESLLFNHINIFHEQIPAADLVALPELQGTFDRFTNPEMINNTPDNAPSKRLQRIIKGYSKVVYGNILAEAIGLLRIRTKCPRFNAWINSIEALNLLPAKMGGNIIDDANSRLATPR